MAAAKEYTVLVIGKVGSGKSTICNKILGRPAFQVHQGMAKTFTSASVEEINVPGQQITLKVIDTPDVVSQDHGRWSRNSELNKIDALLPGGFFGKNSADIVLLAVRADKQFTKEDYDCYKTMADRFCTAENLVIAFTHAENLYDVSGVVKQAGKHLEEAYKKAKEKFIVFRHGGNQVVEEVLGQLRKIEEENNKPNPYAWVLGAVVALGYVLLRR